MPGLLLRALANLWILFQNAWRRLWRRRVDYVRLELRGSLPEFADEPAWLQRLLAGARRPESLMRLRRQLQRIAEDPHARGVVLIVRDFDPGWATAQSLRDELDAFRARGKRVVVYMLNADTRSYFAVCAADELLMPPTAHLYLLGVRVEAYFLRDALCRAGIEAEVIAVSPYKSGGDQFSRSEMSPENREQLDRLLDQRFTMVQGAIGAARNLDPDHVHTLINHAPYTARSARERGLIDDTCYEDELATRLGQTITDEGQKADTRRTAIISEWHTATRALRIPRRKAQKSYVAVASVEGIIMAGDNRMPPLPIPGLGGVQAGSDTITQMLRRVERSRRIAALVLHIDSPGGDAFASDMIWREVLRIRQQKPVVVTMGNVAASGGYYIATCANAIIAQPATLTGSIGVYALRPDASPLLARLGVNTTVLNRGTRTELLNGTQPLSEDEREVLRQTVFESYTEFKQRVASGRNLSEEHLDPLAGGRVWTGAEARQHGLVDELGGLPAAVAKARKLAQLPDDPYAPVLRITPGRRTDRLTPQPFPQNNRADVADWLAELTRPRILATLPWLIKE